MLFLQFIKGIIDLSSPTLTPLEKSFLIRLQKARRLIELLDGGAILYSHKLEQETQQGLIETIHKIEDCTTTCSLLEAAFSYTSDQRQHAFQYAPDSLRGTSSLILSAVQCQAGLESTSYQLVKLIVGRIKSQNALPAPDDLYKPTARQEYANYERSYAALLEHFRLLIETLELTKFSLVDPALSHETLVGNANRFEAITVDTQLRHKQLMRAHEERIKLFQELKTRSRAIYIRTRHLVGSTHPVYLAMRKYAIR